LIPPTPKYLHKIGDLDLNDSSSWDIKMIDHEEKEIAVVSADEAKKKFVGTELEKHLPKRFQGELNKIDAEKISFDRKLDILPEDRILILKTYLGIP
jgi:hypothetical protein